MKKIIIDATISITYFADATGAIPHITGASRLYLHKDASVQFFGLVVATTVITAPTVAKADAALAAWQDSADTAAIIAKGIADLSLPADATRNNNPIYSLHCQYERRP